MYLTKCNGVGCKARKFCLRYLIEDYPERQHYFEFLPGKDIKCKKFKLIQLIPIREERENA